LLEQTVLNKKEARMPKVYICDDKKWAIVLNDRSVVGFGGQIPIDQIEPQRLEALIESGRVRVKTVKAEPAAAPKKETPKKKGGK
jgi:hypothetical protein